MPARRLKGEHRCMPYHEGDEIIPGYEVQQSVPGGPLSERYVIRDAQGVYYEVEILPPTVELPQVVYIAYRSLTFVAGVKHPCLPEGHGTIAVPTHEENQETALREVPLWEHAAGRLTLNQLVESIGPLHPAQVVEIILNVCTALLAIDRASRNSTGNSFPHLALSPANIALRENRVPVILGWANRAAFLAETRPPLHQNRFASFLDPNRLSGGFADRRHDVYALAGCLFYLIKGFPPSYQLRINGSRGETPAVMGQLVPLVGSGLADILVRSFRPNLNERPSLEAFARGLDAVQSEVEAGDYGSWRACSACGLMIQNDADLCPLCIRDRILPTEYVPPPALDAPSAPAPLSVPPHGSFASLEELAALLPEIVLHAASRSSVVHLDRSLRQILLYLVGCGLREFAGDLVRDDGALTDNPYWVASELAHRIQPRAADRVEIAREKGALLRWLRGRERSLRYRKSLRADITIAGVRVDISFRGRLYIFRPQINTTVWQKVKRLCRHTHRPVVLIIMRGGVPSVPSDLSAQVVVYAGSPPRRVGAPRLFGWLDEYRFFSFVRGPQHTGGRS